MFTNADATLYLYRKNGKNVSYLRQPIEEVYWEDVRQSTFIKTGQRDAASVLLVIPFESLTDPLMLTQGKNLVVKGIVEDEIDGSTPETLSKSSN